MADNSEPFLPASNVTLVMPDGTRATVSPERAQELISARGGRVETPDENHEAWLKAQTEDRPTQTAIESFAGTTSLGLTDALSHGDEQFAARRRYNPNAALAGEAAGYLVPFGGAGAAAHLGEAAGAGVLEALGGNLTAKVLSGATKGVVEWGVLGAGGGISDLGLEDRNVPMTMEHVITTIGSNALGGAATGAVFGVGGKLLEEGAKAASEYAGARAAKMASKETQAVDRGAFPEVANMDKKAAREALAEEKARFSAENKAAQEAELEVIKKAKQEQAAALLDNVKVFKDGLRSEEGFIPTADKELAKQLRNAKLQIMKSIDNEIGFVGRDAGHNMLIGGLEKQQAAINKALEKSEELLARGEQERAALYDALPQSDYLRPVYLSPEQSAMYREWAGLEKLKKPAAMTVSGEELDAFRDAIGRGDYHPPSVQRVLNAKALLEANQALQEQYKAMKVPPMSEKLAELQRQAEAGSPLAAAIKDHIADLGDKSFGKRMAEAAGGIGGGALGYSVGGPVGAAAGGMLGRELGGGAYDRIIRRIGGANKLRKEAIAGHVSSLFDKAGKAAKRVAPLASKILPAISYVSKDYADGVLGPSNFEKSRDPQVNDFRERAREIDALTERVSANGPPSTIGGQYTVRMRAREALGQRLQAFWAMNPDWGNGAEAVAARRLEFLAEKLPRNPSPPYLQVGPDSWEPSKAEIAKFARYMEAVEHPDRVVQRLSAGNMTPEDAEVLKRVYPGMYSDLQQQLMQKAGELRTKLPYQKRLGLSILMDVSVGDAALDPTVITAYQNLHQQQASQPSPPQQAPLKPFKSTTEEPTPAQKMAGS